MSKPVPVYGGSSRPCSPACALLHAPRCLTTSQVASPVHGVSTTPVTTPQPHPHQPAGQDADPACQGLPLGTPNTKISASARAASRSGPLPISLTVLGGAR